MALIVEKKYIEVITTEDLYDEGNIDHEDLCSYLHKSTGLPVTYTSCDRIFILFDDTYYSLVSCEETLRKYPDPKL